MTAARTGVLVNNSSQRSALVSGPSLLRVARERRPEVKLGPSEVDHVDEVSVVAVAACATLGGLEQAVESLHDGGGDVALEPAHDPVPM